MSQNRSIAIFAVVGCAVFVAVVACAVTAVAIFFVIRERSAPPDIAWEEAPESPSVDEEIEPTVVMVEHLTIAATVNSFSGSTAVTAGTNCNFDVEHRIFSNNTAQCHVDVTCGNNVHLYGGPTTGYFRCEFSRSPARVVGQDLDTTSGDTDGAFVIDTDRSVLEVRDDAQGIHGAFDLRATITSTL